MARRSPQNPRYQKDAQVGSTRRSAASAKPKREAGESGSSASSAKSDKKKSERARIYPDTPEYKRWQKIWLGLLIAALVFSVGAWLTRESSPPSSTLSLIFAYSTLFTAFFVDFTKLRRMRKEYAEEQAKGKKSAGSTSGS